MEGVSDLAESKTDVRGVLPIEWREGVPDLDEEAANAPGLEVE